MNDFEEACAALVAAHPDLAPPRVVVSELPRPFNNTMQWAVKLDSHHPVDFADRARACAFLSDWVTQYKIAGVEIVVDGRADFEWLLRMVELEERLGPFPPNGAAGGIKPAMRRRAEERLKRDEMMRWEDEGGR